MAMGMEADMTSEIEQKLYKYLFPVTERKVYVENEDMKLIPYPEYKAISREDNGKLISIQSKTYQVISNAEIIKPLMEQLHTLDSKWIIDPSHSFVNDQKMRLQITFPDLTFNDGGSDIALSLFLHNSYDSSEGVRAYWGAIRFVCSNGFVFGKVLARYYHKHTKGIPLNNLKAQIEATYEQIPVISERIQILQNLNVSKSQIESVEKQLGKRISNYVKEQKKPENVWILYNYLTWYISHMIEQRLRAAYQMKVSRMFQL
jgi:hypothetical protein